MERIVQVFTVAADGLPRPEAQFTVAESGIDDSATAARQVLEKRGRRIRCVSFTSTGLIAYVEPQP
jgi:hypothetical protein